ncbi:MAG TPA: hypothetical protein DCP69_04930 [Candidatus Omnitrophica bacterium]|nr:hypothetical protein [Candidatus Omnitrophota bacterium]
MRAFAAWTTHIATLLDCSYEDAAVFLVKLAPLIVLMQDRDFQDKLTRVSNACAAHPLAVEQPTPQGKAIH